MIFITLPAISHTINNSRPETSNKENNLLVHTVFPAEFRKDSFTRSHLQQLVDCQDQEWGNFCKSKAAFQITGNQLGRKLKQQYT